MLSLHANVASMKSDPWCFTLLYVKLVMCLGESYQTIFWVVFLWFTPDGNRLYGLVNKINYWFSDIVSKPSESLFPNDFFIVLFNVPGNTKESS